MAEHESDTIARIPIEEDVSVRTAVVDGKEEIESVKPIWRPEERLSTPVKSYWKWIWLVIVILVIIAWIFLFWYFSNHQAPYSAPIG